MVLFLLEIINILTYNILIMTDVLRRPLQDHFIRPYDKPIQDHFIRPQPIHFVRPQFIAGGDIVKAGLDWLLGYESTRVKQFLKAHGDDAIESLEIGRVPISKMVNLLMNVISAGKFNEIKNQTGTDDFFHLYLIINRTHILEKNETVNVKAYTKSANELTYNIPITNHITINQLINTASHGDEKNFWGEYDPLSSNCQQWVTKVLKRNNLLGNASSFINQNMEALIKGLPNWTKIKSKEITDVASYVNRILQFVSGGRLGFSRGGILRRRFIKKTFL